MENKRILYLDLLRIISIFAMILLHVVATKWYVLPVNSFEWQVMNVYDSVVRFCVPVFIMISGVFFLNPDKKITLKIIFKKYIFRLIIVYLVWSLLYTIEFIINSDQKLTMDSIFSFFIYGRYHLWFIFMIIGLYLITPILRKIVVDKKTMEYFLILFLIFNILINALKYFSGIYNTLEPIINNMNIGLILGYAGYYVLGYYLYKYKIDSRFKVVIYTLGILSLLFTIFITNKASLVSGIPVSFWYEYLLPNTLILAISIFIFFKDKVSKIKFKNKTVKVIEKMSSLSLGVYVCHEFYNILFLNIGFEITNFNIILSIIIMTIIIFTLSYLTSYLISKIPIINKYII